MFDRETLIVCVAEDAMTPRVRAISPRFFTGWSMNDTSDNRSDT